MKTTIAPAFPPTDTWTPIVIQVADVKVHIYRHLVRRQQSVTYLVQCCRYGQTYRLYRTRLEEATKEAEKMANNLARGERSAAKVSLKDLSYYKKCEQALNGVPLHVAVAFYLQEHIRPIEPVSVPNAIRAYLGHLEEDETLSRSHVHTRRSHLLRFGEEFASVRIQDVRSTDIDEYLGNQKWKGVTRDNIRRSLIAFFNYAQRKGHVDRHLRTEAELSEPIRFKKSAPLLYSVAEMKAILANADYATVPFIALGAFAGLRSQEIQRLQWSAIDAARGAIRMSRDITKTGRERLVPILPNLAVLLAPYRHLRGPVMQSLEMNRAKLQEKLRGAAGAAGLDWKHNGLRHSFASYYLALTEDPGKTSLACGHSVDVLNSIYKSISVGDDHITKALAEEYFEIGKENAKTY